MEILQLKYFCDAAETQNFSKTAKKFLVPTSNISQTIKRLENELGTSLFERHANKIRLNETGLLFYKDIKSALDLIENAKNTIKNESQIQTIKININITRRVVMEVIEKFRKVNPEVYFITVHNTSEPLDEFDIIVSDKELNVPYLKTEAGEENLLLAYNKDAFAFHSDIISSELKNAPFITMGSGSSVYDSTQKICNSLGFAPHIVLQSEDPFYIRKCIELGLGVSIIPEISWQGQFSEKISLKKIGENKRNIYVYKKHSTNQYINTFHDMLINEFSLSLKLA